jgi:hypothetical protein
MYEELADAGRRHAVNTAHLLCATAASQLNTAHLLCATAASQMNTAHLLCATAASQVNTVHLLCATAASQVYTVHLLCGTAASLRPSGAKVQMTIHHEQFTSTEFKFLLFQQEILKRGDHL